MQAASFPLDWKQVVEKYCAFYRRLPEPDPRELEGHIQVFLAEKRFEGCGGLTITDEIKVCIAAHACLLLLHRNTDYYPALQTILVYLSHYFGSATQLVSPGVLVESQQDPLGESWGREGVVVLAWDALCSETKTPEQGENVVFHEFAHQLDYESGSVNGAPVLGAGESRSIRKSRYATWARVMGAEYEQLWEQVRSGKRGFLPSYGATNPAEFFAVATETFFGKPLQMQQQEPELYAELRMFYQQDPEQWRSGAQS